MNIEIQLWAATDIYVIYLAIDLGDVFMGLIPMLKLGEIKYN